MKNLWILFISLAIVSCKKEENVNYAIVSGTIENSTSDSITIYDAYNNDIKKEVALTNGKFVDTLALENNFYFVVEDRNVVYFYAEEGDNLQLQYDSKKLDSTLTFTGNNVTVSNYLSKKRKIGGGYVDMRELYTKNEGDFLTTITDKKQKQDDFLFNFNDLPEEFIKKQQADINYDFQNSLSKYELYHGYYANKKDYKISDTIKNALKDVDFNKLDDYIFSSYYRDLVQSNYGDIAMDLHKKDSTLPIDVAFFKAISDIEVDEIRNNLAYNNAKFGITFTDNLDDYYEMYSKVSTNEANNKKIDEDYKKLKVLSKGSPSPKFVDYENNAGGTTSLADLKGKYVYIDVWATWCGPCIAEIPSLKKLEKEYHDKNIAFVSISIDDEKDHDKWKKMIVDKELGGTQLFADNNWDSQFVQDYMIKGIPRFILLDPEGKIINANAARPSDQKLSTILKELNI